MKNEFDPANPNSGHGHVYHRPDGERARCGGPGICAQCSKDQAQKEAVRQQAVPLRYTSDGELAECPCCGSLDVGGAHDTVNCYGCGLEVTKPKPLQNAVDAWNARTVRAAAPPAPDVSGLVEALEAIAHPIPYLRREAEKEGGKLDGGASVYLIQDTTFYRDIARAALQAHQNREG
ncbi:MAG: hypothetical protein JKY26_06505 [Pseudomonas sp.]|nr:hypothetical protein [Pseudomonas sp.]